MSETLPKGWTTTKIGEILQVKSGDGLTKKQMADSGTILVYGGNGITGYHDNYNISEETIVIGRVGYYCGSVHMTPDRAWVTDNAFITRYSESNIDKKFLYYLLNSTDLRLSDSSTAQPVISGKKIYPIEVLLPPLPEQKRIAAKLDCLLAKVDACKARLDKVPEIIKRFRQSVLADAVSGKLTEDWRKNKGETAESATDLIDRNIEKRRTKKKEKYIIQGKERFLKFKEPVSPNMSFWNKDLPKGWCVASVSQFAECLDSLRVPVKKEDRKSSVGLYPYYGANGEVDRVDEYIFDDDLVLVTEDETFYGREKPIAYLVSGKCWVNNHAHVLRTNNLISTKYLCFSLMHYNVLPWLTGTTGRAKLTQGALNELPIAIPPFEEQKEIVTRVESFFLIADHLSQKLSTTMLRIDRLNDAILTKAFRGELVPQYPNDEPAEMLLKRIRTEREALAESKKKGGRTSKKGSDRNNRPPTQKAEAEVESEPAPPKTAKADFAKETDGTVRPLKQAPKHIKRRFERADLLQAFRKAAFRRNGLNEDALLRLVGRRLGVRRLSQPIRRELETAIATALRRNIIARNGTGYYGATPTIHHYDDTELIKVLRSVIRKGYEYEREHLTVEAAVYLGFDKVSDAFAEKMKVIFRLAIRRGQIYRNGRYVGKV